MRPNMEPRRAISTYHLPQAERGDQGKILGRNNKIESERYMLKQVVEAGMGFGLR